MVSDGTNINLPDNIGVFFTAECFSGPIQNIYENIADLFWFRNFAGQKYFYIAAKAC